MSDQLSDRIQRQSSSEYRLFLSFKPLFALRMAFFECDVFFLGTARRNDGRRLRIECNDGNARPKDPVKNAGTM